MELKPERVIETCCGRSSLINYLTQHIFRWWAAKWHSIGPLKFPSFGAFLCCISNRCKASCFYTPDLTESGNCWHLYPVLLTVPRKCYYYSLFCFSSVAHKIFLTSPGLVPAVWNSGPHCMWFQRRWRRQRKPCWFEMYRVQFSFSFNDFKR